MKLYSYTTVKDEADVIESFVRYNMNVLDGMVISDNCSNDNTLKILKKLKDEGYNIDILEDTNRYFDQNKVRRRLFEYTRDKYKPDFIFPLDADEFIGTYTDRNPREIIEKLDKSNVYRYKMQNYVFIPNMDLGELFIPNRLVNIRKFIPNERISYKCFLSDDIYRRNIELYMGSHKIKFLDESEEAPVIILDDNELVVAHYPIRSKEQTMNKCITGRLNNSSLHSRSEGKGFHQYEILDEIIKYNDLPNEVLYKISNGYGQKIKHDELEIIPKPINTRFCKNLKIMYNEGQEIRILSNVIKTSEAIIDTMREKNKELETENEELKKKLEDLMEIISESDKTKILTK